MAIQGNGGPKGPRLSARSLEEQGKTEPAASPDGVSPSSDPFAGDSFEGKITNVWPALSSSAEGRSDERLAHPPERTPGAKTSGLKSMARVLEQTQGRLAAEYQDLRERATKSLVELREAGFAPDARARAEAELGDTRARMNKLRRRLSDVRRRLKLAYVEAGAASELQLQGRLKSALDELARLPSGLTRSLGALSLAAQALPKGADGAHALALRLDVAGATDRHQLGRALAEVTPGAAVAQHVALLLGRPADARPSGARKLPEGTGAVAALADLLTADVPSAS